MADITNASELFSVKGMVVCITGGGTGTYHLLNNKENSAAMY